MAINKPNEYEKTQASGAFEPIALGGHRLIRRTSLNHQTGQ